MNSKQLTEWESRARLQRNEEGVPLTLSDDDVKVIKAMRGERLSASPFTLPFLMAQYADLSISIAKMAIYVAREESK
ncbi:hypothetical protein ACET67_14970 [Aeromonas veronii]|uniref:hypothetical protein n=1 Tax=Aeromonas enteropelogenes TaxID=29489 RepID=UPI00192021DF|nr:hypothetical protein [Aeromonas enteropelogenes]MBL0523218.1 hypothetical protein [Aeromonas enteropelogenes]